MGLAALALMGVTWPLWWVRDDFPVIPFLRLFCFAPVWLSHVMVAGGHLSALAMLVGPRSRRFTSWSAGMFFVTMVIAVLFDQLRLQPWVYELLWITLLLMLAPNVRGLSCVRLLVVSIYLWSAFSKLDPLFVEAHGRMLFDGMAKAANISTVFWPKQMIAGCIWMMPIGEFLVGLLLLIPRMRYYGLLAAIFMHGILIATFSPLGLDHGASVMGWNVLFIAQAWVLFRGNRTLDVEQQSMLQKTAPWIAVSIAVLFPALNLFGYADNWPSWSVYSSRPTFVSGRYTGGPSTTTTLAGPDMTPDSFSNRKVPPYPQVRWKLAILAGPYHELRYDFMAEVSIEVRVSWWSTELQRIRFESPEELDLYLEQYWINTEPARQ